MRVPLQWLKELVAVDASAEEVATRLTMGGLEVEGIEASTIGPVLDVYVTPNRGDCLSLLGVAREVAALYDAELRFPEPPGSEPVGEAGWWTDVTIEAPDLCPRYAARLVRGVVIGPSPDWMQRRLEAAGMRPINNVVDVTNYVMLEVGQPLHAFDLDKLDEGRIVVRRARAGETVQTLDGEPRPLTPEMLVIADAAKAVAVAGVMGGAESEIGDDTTNLLLESAHFNPLSIRRTSRVLNLRTEASYRFERVVDPDGVRRAVDRACELLALIGRCEVVPGVVDVYPEPVAQRTVQLRVRRVTDLLGIPDITPDVAADCLRRLGFGVAEAGETLVVSVPSFRPDIALEEDLVEEVGRIYGYENIPESLPVGCTTRGGDSAEGRLLSRIRETLVRCGLQEVVTHSLGAPSFFNPEGEDTRRVAVRNALSGDVGGLRNSLLPAMLDVAEANFARGQQSVSVFEIGRVWHDCGTDGEVAPVETLSIAGLLVGPFGGAGWQRDARPTVADFALARGVVDRLCAGIGVSSPQLIPVGRTTDAASFHPGRTAVLAFEPESLGGIVGELHPRLAPRLSFRDRIYLFEVRLDALSQALSAERPPYRPVSRYQAVARDLAPRVREDLAYAEVEAAVRDADVDILESYRLTDVFRGEPLPPDTKSLTLSFMFRSTERTLTDADVAPALASLRTALESRCRATFVA